tara:strand:+ start:638 stop:742 length:105 start_codon:yes stop_codon:yes gene_type:complete
MIAEDAQAVSWDWETTGWLSGWIGMITPSDLAAK